MSDIIWKTLLCLFGFSENTRTRDRPNIPHPHYCLLLFPTSAWVLNRVFLQSATSLWTISIWIRRLTEPFIHIQNKMSFFKGFIWHGTIPKKKNRVAVIFIIFNLNIIIFVELLSLLLCPNYSIQVLHGYNGCIYV